MANDLDTNGSVIVPGATYTIGGITITPSPVAQPDPATLQAPPAFSLLSLHDRPWAMTRAALDALVEACGQLDLDAVATRACGPMETGGSVPTHNGTAVVRIRGPLVPYRSFWTSLLGGTAVEQLALDLQAAVDDPGVQRIVLRINSPGGQIDGIHALANSIRAATQIKPVTAYVEGMGASAAYWLASAAGRIVADETAQLGSIGVLATAIDTRGFEEKLGVKRYEIVSSQSPLKRTDPATDEGRAQLQGMVDALAQVFIDKVAKFRGTSAAKVERDFGQGAVMPAAAAVTVGMADSLGSLEELLNEARQPKRALSLRAAAGVQGPAAGLIPEDEECDCIGEEGCECDEEANAALAAAAEGEEDLLTPTEERQRIAAILNCEEARGREELARALALETNHTLETAQLLLRAAPVAAAAPVNALEARMSQIPNPNVGTAPEAVDNDSPVAEIARIMAFVPKARRHPAVQ